MKHLYFVRHGQSVMNVSGHFAGHADTPLTDIGRIQAKTASLAAQAHAFDLIVSSPLLRASETAHIIAQEIGYPTDKIILNPLLMERDYGEVTGLPFSSDPDFESFPGFENDTQLLARAQKAADWLNSLDAEIVLVASHGTFGWVLRQIYDPAARSAPEASNAEIVQFL